MKKLIFLFTIFVFTINLLQSQTDYYWSNSKKQNLSIITTKKFILVDETITDSASLVLSLNDTSLTVSCFTKFRLPPQLSLDSLNMYKRCAIIESNDSIDINALISNNHVEYVSGYYYVNDTEIGTSHIFYVKLINSQDTVLLDSIASIQKTNIVGNFNNMPLWYVIECSENSLGDALTMSNVFYETGLFDYSHPNLINNYRLDEAKSKSVFCTNDNLFHKQWGLNNVVDNTNVDISACEAWEFTKGNTNVIIAILDSGVKLDHSDLTNVDANISYDLITESSPSVLYPNSSYSKYRHGTNCAGIIGAEHNNIGVAGVAPNCTVMSLSLDWSTAYDFENDIDPIDYYLAAGIDYAWQNGADVISNSWSGASDQDIVSYKINEAVTYGRNNRGCIIVNSTGNGNNLYVSFPCENPDIIAVGAIDSCGVRGKNLALPSNENNYYCGSAWPYGSNYGTGLSVVAPGTDISTTTIVDNFGMPLEYSDDFGGTSAAAPHVSGVAALVLSINPDLNYYEVKDIIEETAQKINYNIIYNYDFVESNGIWDNRVGYGLVNAYDALMLTFTNMCNINSHITTGQNITWSEQKYACSNIVVDGTLTIDAPLNFHLDNPQITVNNGGHLIIEDDCNIEVWIDELFTGNIIVNAGGTLEIMSGATLSVFEDGQINILTNSGSNGQLIFNQGATIDLHNDNTLLNIAGNLIIENNAQFTFTGDGYVKFSNPGDDQITNISCGTGSSMLFSGNGQNDKVLEVDQATVRFPAMSSLTFENCKIEMASGSPGRRMLSDGNNPITFNNVKLTSTTGINNSHRSFNFYGQNNITVSNSTFEYGYYGINAIMSYTAGAPMTFNNCTFQNNYYGIKAYSKGIDLIDCIVKDNTSYGLYCTAMSFPSEILISSINYNQSGMYYQGSSSSDIDVSYSNFVGNSSNGIYTSGNFDLDMSCSHIGNNTYGVYTRYGTNLRIDQNARNEITDNTRSIYLNYGLLFANSGYNQLYAANNGYAVYGQTNLIFQPYTVYAHHNRWEYSNPGAAPNYDVNYKLWVYNSPPTPNLTVDIIDNNRGYAICPGLILLPGIQTGGAVVSGANSEENEMLSDIAIQVKALELQSENIESAAGFEGIMEQYCTLIIDADISNNVDTKYWQYIAYSDAHKLVNMLYDKTGQDVENEQLNSLINKLIELNNILSENSEIHYSRYVEYQLDNGLLERFRNNTDEAISLLNQLREELVLTEYTDELANIDTWLCYLENEKLAQQGLLNPDEFMIATENCEQCHSADLSEMELKNSGLSSPSDKDEPGDIEQNNVSANTLTIMPNPNNGEFAINVNTNCANCEIFIYNSLGQEVKKYKHNSESGNAIFVSGLNKGQYTVVITEDKQVIDTEKIVVK